MAWQCHRDGSTNMGVVCKVCGGPPYDSLPVLRGDTTVIRPSSRQLVVGAKDWPVGPKRKGLARFHMRVFFDVQGGKWQIANISNSGRLAINGTDLPPGQRVPLDEGDILLLGEHISLRVTYEKL